MFFDGMAQFGDASARRNLGLGHRVPYKTGGGLAIACRKVLQRRCISGEIVPIACQRDSTAGLPLQVSKQRWQPQSESSVSKVEELRPPGSWSNGTPLICARLIEESSRRRIFG